MLLLNQPRPSASGGLSAAQVAQLLQQYGPNEVARRPKAASALAWLFRLIADPMVLLLAAAGGTYLLLGDRFDAIVTSVALLPIFAVGAVLEYRSDRALERLNELAAPQARVLRDGVEQTIAARDVVPGDTLLLREGDVVAADADVIDSVRLQVDESSLTGESLPVHKTPGGNNRVQAGTIVRSGRGACVVTATGASSEYGRIAGTLAKMKPRATPIERAIHRLVAQAGGAVVVVCAIVIVTTHFHGDPWGVAIIAGISLAMAAVPEELPMVYTLYLALGAWRLAKDSALVRRLSSVETLGATTVICVDKTGTLTHGTLSIESVFCAPGFTPAEVRALAAAASDPAGNDPLDAVLLSQTDLPAIERTRIIPFDPAQRFAGAYARIGSRLVQARKGAFEAIAARAEGPAHAFLDAATARGARVLAVSADDTFAGSIAFADPVRSDAASAVDACRRAGIRLMMITGDHPATAQTIAQRVGIAPENVYARIRPEEKLQIVRDLHARGEIVAMTGDGTNDALALREADIGIAMGKAGTEVARSAADLVLLDDDVTTIVRAVADGRRIFANLQHAFRYLNAFHAPLLLSALLLPLLGLPILLLPVHLIALELIVHPTSALVFENDPPAADTMQRPPRDPNAPLLAAADWIRTIAMGVVLSAAVIGAYAYLLAHGLDVAPSRSAALICMLAGQMTLVISERTSPFARNLTVPVILAATVALMAAGIWYAPIANALHLAPVSLALAGTAALVGVAAVLAPLGIGRLFRIRSVA